MSLPTRPPEPGEPEERPRARRRWLGPVLLGALLALSLAANVHLLTSARSASQRAVVAEQRLREAESRMLGSEERVATMLHALNLIRGRSASLQRTARELEQIAGSAVAGDREQFPEPE